MVGPTVESLHDRHSLYSLERCLWDLVRGVARYSLQYMVNEVEGLKVVESPVHVVLKEIEDVEKCRDSLAVFLGVENWNCRPEWLTVR